MKIEVNIEKKYLVVILVGIFIVAGIFGVIAYGGNSPQIVGHSSGEIMVNINGLDKTLQEAINDGSLSGENTEIETFSSVYDPTEVAPSFSFTPNFDGKAFIIVKGNFGTSCGAGSTGDRLVNLNLNGNVVDSAFQRIFDDHCGSRTFSLMSEEDVISGQNYLLDLSFTTTSGNLAPTSNGFPYSRFSVVVISD